MVHRGCRPRSARRTDFALVRHEAAEAVKLFYRSAATGAVPLRAGSPLLDRVFAVVVGDKSIEPAAFRELARVVGWDNPAHEGETSELRKRVLARLAAEDWQESLVNVADGRGEATRKQVKLARLMLGRIGSTFDAAR